MCQVHSSESYVTPLYLSDERKHAIMRVIALRCESGGWKDNQTVVGASASRFNACVLHSSKC